MTHTFLELREGSSDDDEMLIVRRSSFEETLPFLKMVVDGIASGLYFFLFAFRAFMSLRNGVGKRTSWNGTEKTAITEEEEKYQLGKIQHTLLSS